MSHQALNQKLLKYKWRRDGRYRTSDEPDVSRYDIVKDAQRASQQTPEAKANRLRKTEMARRSKGMKVSLAPVNLD